MRPCARALAPDPGAEAIRVREAGLAYRFGRCRTKRSSMAGLPGCTHLGREAPRAKLTCISCLHESWTDRQLRVCQCKSGSQ